METKLWTMLELVDEPFICGEKVDFEFISPIHSLPLKAVDMPVEPQSIAISPEK